MPDYSNNNGNYFCSYWNQASYRPTCNKTEINEDYPYGIIPRWKHLKVTEIQTAKMINSRYLKIQKQHERPIQFFWIFPFQMFIYKKVEDIGKDMLKEEYNLHFLNGVFKLSVKDFDLYL